MQVGRNQMMNFSKSRPRRISADQPKVTFSDVAAVDEAIQKLTEIKEFLKVPQRLQTLVGRMPKAPC